MPTFPNQTASAVYVYYLSAPKPLPRVSLADLRMVLADRMMEHRAPDDLCHPDGKTTGDVWGWYWPNNVGPIHVNHHLGWGLRTWTKTVDSSLLNAKVSDKEAMLERALQNDAAKITKHGGDVHWKELREMKKENKRYDYCN